MSDGGSPKTLVLVFGPPAVGKMAVGKELERLTGFPLLHNHMTIDLVLPFFEFGTPTFTRLVGEFRRAIEDAVLESDHEGLIVTYVWTFDEPGDLEHVRKLRDKFSDAGGRAVFVELTAPLEVRLERNDTPLRLAEKPSKRDVDASNRRLRDIDQRYRMNSGGQIPFENHLIVDTTERQPSTAAQLIVDTFGLPVQEREDA